MDIKALAGSSHRFRQHKYLSEAVAATNCEHVSEVPAPVNGEHLALNVGGKVR